MGDRFSTDGVGHGGGGSGSNASGGERWGVAVNIDEASLARPPLTSCCAARFLTAQGPVLVCGPGVGDPCSNGPQNSQWYLLFYKGMRAFVQSYGVTEREPSTHSLKLIFLSL